jgi:hypothetical protein
MRPVRFSFTRSLIRCALFFLLLAPGLAAAPEPIRVGQPASLRD